MKHRVTHPTGPSLTGISGEREGHVIELTQRITVGRHPQNDVCLDDPTVSAFHAVISMVGRAYEIIDLGSKNKAKINGKKIHRPVLLADHDVLEIGKNKFRFSSFQTDETRRVSADPSGETTEIIGLFETSDEPLHTQKIPRHIAMRYQPIKANARDHDATEVQLPELGGTTREEHGRKARKTGRILANIATGIIVLFVVGLFASRFIEKPPDPSPPERPSTRAESPWDHSVHQIQIQEIWATWDTAEMHMEGDTEDFELLFVNALREADQLTSSAPPEWWRVYKRCIGLLHRADSIPGNPEYRRQCDQLLLRLKIEIEDEGKRLLRLLRGAKNTGQWGEAERTLRSIRQLLDLDNDNIDTELARTCRTLQHEIEDLRDRKQK